MDTVALVTGASQGIGREIALQLSTRGSYVFINYSKSRDNAVKVATEIRSRGGRAEIFRADTADEEQVAGMFAEIADISPHIDFLVNNAGIDIPRPFESYDVADWLRILDVNLTGKFITLKHAVPFLKKAPKPRVVNVASRLAWKPFEESSAYCCSQAAIIMLTKCAALELAPYNIRVNAVCAGLTRTPLTEKIYPDEETWKRAAELNPSMRVGEPRDIANAVLFLLSDEADYINGTHLPVEGGSLLR